MIYIIKIIQVIIITIILDTYILYVLNIERILLKKPAVIWVKLKLYIIYREGLEIF